MTWYLRSCDLLFANITLEPNHFALALEVLHKVYHRFELRVCLVTRGYSAPELSVLLVDLQLLLYLVVQRCKSLLK